MTEFKDWVESNADSIDESCEQEMANVNKKRKSLGLSKKVLTDLDKEELAQSWWEERLI